MRLILATVLGTALCASASVIQFDGDLQEWTTNDVACYGMTKSIESDGLVSEHTLYQTVDSGTLFYGIADTIANNNIITIAIDLDGIANSNTAARTDAYKSITFGSAFRPEFILYAGAFGGDTFTYSVWDGSGWNNYQSYKGEGFDGISIISTDLETEYAINLASLGLESYTSYARSWVAAGKSITANKKLYGWGVSTAGDAGVGLVPEPATLAMLGLGGLLARRKREKR